MKLREIFFGLVVFLIVLGIIMLCRPVEAGPLDETRCCVTPARNADGAIKRSSSVVAAFKRIWPCPSTHLPAGPCPGYKINHAIPLACGGKDEVSNLIWMRDDAKKIQDSYERIIFGGHNMSPGCP